MKCTKAVDCHPVDLESWKIGMEDVEQLIKAQFAETLENVFNDFPPIVQLATFDIEKTGKLEVTLPFADDEGAFVWQVSLSDVVDEFIDTWNRCHKNFGGDYKMVVDLAEHFRELADRLDAPS